MADEKNDKKQDNDNGIKESKIYQPMQVEILRSQINFANYNPRKISDKARNLLKKNLKKVGLLGGVVFNKATGNLISGHQRISIIDEVNHYNPDTKDNDYTLRVECVEMDEKSEKEQNIFMNNKNVQGEFEDDMLRELLTGIDYENAGLEEFDLQLLGIGDQTVEQYQYQPWNKAELTGGNQEEGQEKTIEQQFLTNFDEENKQIPEDRNMDRSVSFAEDTPENQIARHNETLKIRERIANQNDMFKDRGVYSYVIVSFDNPQQKMDFMSNIGLDPYDKYINGNDFSRYIEFGEDFPNVNETEPESDPPEPEQTETEKQE